MAICRSEPRTIARLAAGDNHTCAILDNGAIRCWGAGDAVLGNGSFDAIGDNEPASAAANLGIGGSAVAVTIGEKHACSLRASGKVVCWGDGERGQLGTADRRGQPKAAEASPVLLGDIATSIAAGRHHTCAIVSTGAVRCWGEGADGGLGYGDVMRIGDDESPATLGDVAIGIGVEAITAGDSFTCVLGVDGGIRCWGRAVDGQLGYGNMTPIGDDEPPSSAGSIELGGTAVELCAGDAHACARLDTGAVRCWGRNAHGELGAETMLPIGDDEAPAASGDINLGDRATHIACGGEHTCAILTTGAVRCWGRAENGALGYGDEQDIGDNEAPAEAGDINLGSEAIEVAAGRAHTCAQLKEGGIRCWGHGEHGQLGYGNRDSIGDNEVPATVAPVPLLPPSP